MRNRMQWLLIGLLIGTALGACVRWQPESAQSAPPTAAASSQPTAPAAGETPEGQKAEALSYAVVWVAPDESLVVRQPAGISGDQVAELPADAKGLRLSGQQTLLGSSLWVELVLEGERSGWVNAWYLTEYVPPPDFCARSDVTALLAELRNAVLREDGPLLAQLTHPLRGLVVRHDSYNPDLIFPPEAVAELFASDEELEWGRRADSDLKIVGTFAQAFLPLLQDVLLDPHQLRCNELLYGETQAPPQWPPELGAINFYGLYRPPPEGGNPFDWRTIAVGVEFLQGQPYLAVLIHYTSELFAGE